jgi:hypothetical protein
MSTLCRVGWEWQKHGGAETSEISSFCPTHFSAFQKCRINGGRNISDHPNNFGNISEKQSFSENISDLFSCRRIAQLGLPRRSRFGEGGSNHDKLS